MFSINFILSWRSIHRVANLSETVAFVERTWKELYPAGIFNEIFLEDQLTGHYTWESLIFKGFTVSLSL